MRLPGRYSTAGLPEDEYEPGSRRRVLKNLVGVKRKRDMDGIEAVALARTFQTAIGHFDSAHRFTAEDIRFLHRTWLKDVYAWAGEYRNVNLSRDGFYFAAAQYIPEQMKTLEKEVLGIYTPCSPAGDARIIDALAVVHAELVLIHPFREGNGRLARMLADIMALQAGLPPLNYSMVKGKKRLEYYAAVRAAVGKDYEPMRGIFGSIVAYSRKKA